MSRFSFFLKLFILLALLTSTLAPGTAAVAAPRLEGEPPGIFIESHLQGDDDDPLALRQRLVYVDFALLGGPQGPLAGRAGRSLPLNLFADTAYTALLERVEAGPVGGFIWYGYLAGVEHSFVTLVVNGGALAGSVVSPQGLYLIRYGGPDGLHRIIQVNEAAYPNPEELPPIPVAAAERPLAPGAITGADDGAVIDVLVVYSPEARTAAGSAAALESQIVLAVAEANTTYANSGVNQRLNLVYMGEVTGSANDFATDLPRLRVSDGYMDEALPWRDTYHADNVSLIIENGTSCGLGYVMSSIGLSFESYAFSVVARACLIGSYTLAHELGHNMGARHDWYVDNAITPHTYAHGYVDLANLWRTVMAYNNECNPSICTRLPYWSNPGQSYGGSPMGVPAGTRSNCLTGASYPPGSDCDADDHLTLNTTAGVVAQFRASQITWTGSASTDWGTANNWVIYEGAPGATTPVPRVPRAIDAVLIPTSPSGGRFPTIASGTAEARSVTIQTGAQLNMTGGTLNVYHDWLEQGTGRFNATGGTVVFTGSLSRSLLAVSGSSFYHVQVGDGASTQTATAASSLDINGNLTIQAGATLEGGSGTLAVAGNWTEGGPNFLPGSSTVVLDGAAQTLDKVTTLTLLTQNFNTFTGCCSSALPSGWVRANPGSGFGMATGDLLGGGNPSVQRWSDTANAWLFTSGLSLRPGFRYELSFKYRTYNTNQSSFAAYYGSSQTIGGMTNLIVSLPNVASGVYQTSTTQFTVASAGVYYIGFNNQSAAANYGLFDDITLTAIQDLNFYNLTVNSAAAATLNQNLAVQNNLTIGATGALSLQDKTVTVDGTLANNGLLQAAKPVPASGQTRFMYIRNAAGSVDKYYGIDITIPGAVGMGSTTVKIKGNQTGGCDANNELIQRCYVITPTTQVAATLRFWYLNAERGAENPAIMKAYHYNDTLPHWNRLDAGGELRGTVGAYEYVEVDNVSVYSGFGASDGDPSDPTAVQVTNLAAASRSVWPLGLLLGAVLALLLGLARWRRRH